MQIYIFYEIYVKINTTIYVEMFSKLLDEMINIFSMFETFIETYRPNRINQFFFGGALKKK